MRKCLYLSQKQWTTYAWLCIVRTTHEIRNQTTQKKREEKKAIECILFPDTNMYIVIINEIFHFFGRCNIEKCWWCCAVDVPLLLYISCDTVWFRLVWFRLYIFHFHLLYGLSRHSLMVVMERAACILFSHTITIHYNTLHCVLCDKRPKMNEQAALSCIVQMATMMNR